MRNAYVDIHAHYFPKSFLDLIDRDGRTVATIDQSSSDGPVIEVGSRRSATLRPAFWDLDIRIQEMDAQGILVHALSLSPPMLYWADDQLGLRLAQTFNNAISEAHIAFPERFFGLATLPMQNPQQALEELERAATLKGIRGIYMGTNILGKDLAKTEFFPIFERMQALRLPLFLHPTWDIIGQDRLAPYYFRNLLGNPFESAVAASSLIFGSVLDRLQSLQVCLPHAGGAFLSLIGRLDHGWKVRPECQHLQYPPSDYLRRFHYDTISHSSQTLGHLIDLVGSDRVMLGSDYCFDMGYEQPVQIVTQLPGLDDEAKKRILRENAARFLGLA